MMTWTQLKQHPCLPRSLKQANESQGAPNSNNLNCMMDSFKEANPNCEFSKVQTWSKIRWDSVSSSNGNIGKNQHKRQSQTLHTTVDWAGWQNQVEMSQSESEVCVTSCRPAPRVECDWVSWDRVGIDWTDLTLARHVSSQCPPSLLTIPACLTISTMSTWA